MRVGPPAPTQPWVDGDWHQNARPSNRSHTEGISHGATGGVGPLVAYLGHLPDGHHTVQGFLQPLIVLLLHVGQKRGGYQRGPRGSPQPNRPWHGGALPPSALTLGLKASVLGSLGSTTEG